MVADRRHDDATEPGINAVIPHEASGLGHDHFGRRFVACGVSDQAVEIEVDLIILVRFRLAMVGKMTFACSDDFAEPKNIFIRTPSPRHQSQLQTKPTLAQF